MERGLIELNIAERDIENKPIDGKRSNVLFGYGQHAAEHFARTALRGLKGQERFNRELELFGGVE